MGRMIEGEIHNMYRGGLYGYFLSFHYAYDLDNMKSTIRYSNIEILSRIASKPEALGPVSWDDFCVKNPNIYLVMLVEVLTRTVIGKYFGNDGSNNQRSTEANNRYTYDKFLEDYLWVYEKVEINTISDYLDFIKAINLSFNTPYNFSGRQSSILFDAKSENGVKKDFLGYLRQIAIAGSIKCANKEYELDLKRSDDLDLLQENEQAVSNGEVEWINENDHALSVYNALTLNEGIDYFKTYCVDYSRLILDIQDEAYRENNPSPLDYPDDIEDYLALVEDFGGKFKEQLALDIEKILQNVQVIRACHSYYCLNEGMFGPIYYFIIGYNPVLKCGEGIFLEDFCR